MQKIAILTDSGCDVPACAIEKYNMFVLPLKISYADQTYTDNVDIAPADVYARFPAQIPKTSTPNVSEVLKEIDRIRAAGYTHVIAISISSGLSGTYNTVASALSEVTDLTTYAFDTKNISIGAGIFAVYAGQMIRQEMDFDQIVKELEQSRTQSKIYYYMDTLDYLIAGGRIGRVAGKIGGVLRLKPIISCNEDGVYYPVGVVKSKQRGLQKLVQLAAGFADGAACSLALMHGDAPQTADVVVPMLQEALPGAPLVAQGQIAASLAVHTGPGLIGILVFKQRLEA